jgi:hypothetical protein
MNKGAFQFTVKYQSILVFDREYCNRKRPAQGRRPPGPHDALNVQQLNPARPTAADLRYVAVQTYLYTACHKLCERPHLQFTTPRLEDSRRQNLLAFDNQFTFTYQLNHS